MKAEKRIVVIVTLEDGESAMTAGVQRKLAEVFALHNVPDSAEVAWTDDGRIEASWPWEETPKGE